MRTKPGDCVKSARSTTPGRGSSHGRRATGSRNCAAAPWIAFVIRSMSRGPDRSRRGVGSVHACPGAKGRSRTWMPASGAAVPARPPTYAVWKSRTRPAPSFAAARPGVSASNVAARGVPRTSTESASSATRNATRRFVFARSDSLMTPAGRCVAMMRCNPSERPRCAMSMTPSTNAGTSVTRAANSSITITNAGGASGSPRSSSAARSFAPFIANSSSRRVNSARRLVRARATRCGVRSVTSPTV